MTSLTPDRPLASQTHPASTSSRRTDSWVNAVESIGTQETRHQGEANRAETRRIELQHDLATKRRLSLNRNDAIALLAGAIAVLGFAPYGNYLLPVLSLAVLFFLLQRAETARRAARLGWMFGLGLFGVGIGWLYVALHQFGGMSEWLAALATLLFAACFALFPALAAYLQARWRSASRTRWLLVMPAVWVLSEWLRGMLFTGFPWLTLGYAHSDSPLAGYAPLLGVYGVSWLAAVSAGALALLFAVRLKPDLEKNIARLPPHTPFADETSPNATLTGEDMSCTSLEVELAGNLRSRCSHQERLGGVGASNGQFRFNAVPISIALLVLIWGAGALLHNVAWTQPVGAPLTVALLQGNVGQEVKFVDDELTNTLETYRRLALQSRAQLTVLPETALPVLRHQVPAAWLEQLRDHAQQQGGDVLIGSFEREAGEYYNSVFSTGTAHEQHYLKQHLVPFGEFIPLRPVLGWLINDVLNIPMGDLQRGTAEQALLAVAGQRVAVNICYEDVFGEEIIRALPQASLLVNVTNDAWYGHSDAAAQHNQIAQMRALETGRMLLRATNTGVTSIIAANGKVRQQLPQHQQATLLGEAQGYQGRTPYVRWGNTAILLILLTSLTLSWRNRQRNSLLPSPLLTQAGEGRGEGR